MRILWHGQRFRKEIHSASLYGLLSLASFFTAFTETSDAAVVFVLVAVPALVSTYWARNAVRKLEWHVKVMT